jgi:hypothetical protein
VSRPFRSSLTKDLRALERRLAGQDAGIGPRWQSRLGHRAPDGSTHTGQAKVHPEAKAGTLATVRVDRQGRLRPLTPGEASFQASWTGVLAGLGVAGSLLGGAQLVRLDLARRQSRQRDEEWARVDTPWGRTAG